jgi:hypothetical protein
LSTTGDDSNPALEPFALVQGTTAYLRNSFEEPDPALPAYHNNFILLGLSHVMDRDRGGNDKTPRAELSLTGPSQKRAVLFSALLTEARLDSSIAAALQTMSAASGPPRSLVRVNSCSRRTVLSSRCLFVVHDAQATRLAKGFLACGTEVSISSGKDFCFCQPCL